MGLDTPAEELLGEPSKDAARIDEFFGLLMAARAEGLVELSGMCRVGSGESVHLGIDRLKIAYEREASAVADEWARAERQFNPVLDREPSHHQFGQPLP